MYNKFDDVKGYLAIGTIFLVDLLIILGVIVIFFGTSKEILAGIIGFIGAILGGVITYIGVKETIKSRDEELFLEKASKKIFIIEDFINSLLKSSYNRISLTEINDDNSIDFRNMVLDLLVTINVSLDKLKEVLEYKDLHVLLFHIRSLEKYVLHAELNQSKRIEYLIECKEKTRDIYTELVNNKDELIKNYYYIKNKRNIFKRS